MPDPASIDPVEQIRNLLSQYVAAQDTQRPLSIALFGENQRDIASFVQEFSRTVASPFSFGIHEIDIADLIDLLN